MISPGPARARFAPNYCLPCTMVLLVLCISGKLVSQTWKDTLHTLATSDQWDTYYDQCGKYINQHMDIVLADKIVTPDEWIDFSATAGMLDLESPSVSAATQFKKRRAYMRAGYCFSARMGKYAEALPWYLKAHALVDDPECLDTLAWYIENQISSIYARLNDYENAIRFGALVKASLLHFDTATTYTNLPRAYTNLGFYYFLLHHDDNAIRYYDEAYSISKEWKFTRGQLASALKFAEFYIQKEDSAQAEKWIRESEILLASPDMEKNKLTYSVELENLKAEWNLKRQHLPEAKRHLDATVHHMSELYQTTSRREFAKVYLSLARIWLEEGDTAMARCYVSESIGCIIPGFAGNVMTLLRHDLPPENTLVELFLLQSRIRRMDFAKSQDTTRLRQALYSAELALYVNDILRTQLFVDDSKLLSIEENKSTIDVCISILYQLHEIHPQESNQVKAREFFNQSKSLLLHEKTANQIALAQMSAMDRQAYLLHQAKLRELQEYRRTQPELDAQWVALIVPLEASCKALLSGKDEARRAEISPPSYIEYQVQQNEVYALASNGTSDVFCKLAGGPSLDTAITTLHRYILSRRTSDERAILRELYDQLIAPIPLKWNTELTIIPDAELALIPFEILMSQEEEYWFETVTVSYAFHFVQQQSAQANPGPLSFFCFAPSYVPDPDVMAMAERGGIYHLPHARREMEALDSILTDPMRIDSQLSKSEWIHQMSLADVFHFAGHAIVEEDRAYLALSDSVENGICTDDEIRAHYFPMKLVVLSACETGLGRISKGEGMRSLGRSFIEAGSASVVYSLWTVNDKSSAEMMRWFYHFLKKGFRKNDAMRKAKLQYLKEAHAVYRHPYFWAGFVVAGDTQPVYQKNRGPLIIAASAVFFIMITLLWSKRNNSLSHKSL